MDTAHPSKLIVHPRKIDDIRITEIESLIIWPFAPSPPFLRKLLRPLKKLSSYAHVQGRSKRSGCRTPMIIYIFELLKMAILIIHKTILNKIFPLCIVKCDFNDRV